MSNLVIMLTASKFVDDHLKVLCQQMEQRSAAIILPFDSEFYQLVSSLAGLELPSSYALAEQMIRSAAVQHVAES